MAEAKKPDAVEALGDTITEQSEKGYRGVVTDPTPNENYTVAGVTAGKPTPETDPAQAEKVKKHQSGLKA